MDSSRGDRRLPRMNPRSNWRAFSLPSLCADYAVLLMLSARRRRDFAAAQPSTSTDVGSVGFRARRRRAPTAARLLRAAAPTRPTLIDGVRGPWKNPPVIKEYFHGP